MGGLSSLNKGKRGEREVIALLQPVVTQVYDAHGYDVPKLQRNTLQSDSGGCDVAGLEWLALEVKFCETLQVNKWWEQAVRQAGKSKEPVLLYRQSNKAWRVVMWGYVGLHGHRRLAAVTVDIEEFMFWFRARLVEELT